MRRVKPRLRKTAAVTDLHVRPQRPLCPNAQRDEYQLATTLPTSARARLRASMLADESTR